MGLRGRPRDRAFDLDGVGDSEIVYLGGHAGRILSDPVGPGFLRGRLAIGVEVLPLALVFQHGTSYGFSTTLLGRHYFETPSRVRPFVSLGAGFLWTASELPASTSRVNFTPQVGLGVAFADGARFFAVEYRIHHISNADLATPNPGINSSLVQFRASFVRARERGERRGSRTSRGRESSKAAE